jgi:hypothetical protein
MMMSRCAAAGVATQLVGFLSLRWDASISGRKVVLDRTWTKLGQNLDRFLSFSRKVVLDRNWTELDRILSFEGTDYRRRLLPVAATTTTTTTATATAPMVNTCLPPLLSRSRETPGRPGRAVAGSRKGTQ